MTAHRPRRLRLLVAALASLLLLAGATMASAASTPPAQLGKGSGAGNPPSCWSTAPLPTPAAGTTSLGV